MTRPTGLAADLLRAARRLSDHFEHWGDNLVWNLAVAGLMAECEEGVLEDAYWRGYTAGRERGYVRGRREVLEGVQRALTKLEQP